MPLALILLALPQVLQGVALVRKPNEFQEVSALRQEPTEKPAEELPWYAKVSMFHFPQMFATDVDGPALLQTLANVSAGYVLVDFYAPWCPHCQHFAPDFERLALRFHQLQERKSVVALPSGSLKQQSAPTVFTATVDCVRFAATCTHWGVKGYPTLRWGKRSDWFANSAEKLLDEIDVRPIDAEGVADWISTRLNINLNPLPTKSDLSKLAPSKSPVVWATADALPSQTYGADVWDAQLASALLVHTALTEDMFQGKPRAAFLDLVSLMSTHFPEPDNHTTCRDSFAILGKTLKGYPQTMHTVDTDQLDKSWQPCGVHYSEYEKGWHSCRGTWPGKRGFTCGLWTLFHMLAARSNDTSASHHLEILRSTVGNFFKCKECHDAFLAIPEPVSGAANQPLTRREVQLWWWNAHNIVNRRVMGIEEKFQDADLNFPKLAWWPSADSCPKCRRSSNFVRVQRSQKMKELPTVEEAVQYEGWDLEEVGAFLDRFYWGSSMLR